MSAVVRGYEPGSNLKLITKQLKAVAKATPDSVFVCVGDTIETEEPDYLKGHGTALIDGRLVATLCGVVQRINKLIFVQPLKSRYTPEVGDVVVGRVTEIAGKRWKIDLNSRQEAGLLISAVNLPGGVQRRRNAEDELNMRSMFREGDLISAEVQGKSHDGGIQLHTRSSKFGKLGGGQLVAIHAKLVKKQRFHFTTLKGLDVDLIAGLNGLLWVSPHIQRAEDGTPLQDVMTKPTNTSSLLGTLNPPGNPNPSLADDPAAIAAAAAAAAAGSGPSLQQREAVVRVAGAIRALAALMLQVYPDSIVNAYQVRSWMASALLRVQLQMYDERYSVPFSVASQA
eukprot:GHUV01030672.1.p1 GENE.GHUV01030672.1~~GHUV01030672.1.p1  ORF type:complete len:341 (+),score=80.58 GHUV01030672.1:584-1606(+)